MPLEEGICAVDSCRRETSKDHLCEECWPTRKPTEAYDYSVSFKHPPFDEEGWFKGTVGTAVMWDEGDEPPIEELKRLIQFIGEQVG